MKTMLKIRIRAGSRIHKSIQLAIELAKKHNRKVRFRFNGLTITVNKRLSVDHVQRQFYEQMHARHNWFVRNGEYR